jgi:hypothetical protein
VEWSQAGHLQDHHYDRPLREYSLSHLKENHGVKVHQGARIAEVTHDNILLDSGEMIPYGTLVWNAGMLPVPLVKSLNVEKNNEGKVMTDEFCRVMGQADMFAIGDCAQIMGKKLPATARVASQQGVYLAKQLNSEQSAGSEQPFAMKGICAIAGKLPGTDSPLGKLPLARRLIGIAAHLEWRAPSWTRDVSFQNRVSRLYDRISAGVFGRSLVREGQDSLETPTKIAARRQDRPGGSLDPQQERAEMNMLLKDIGMDGDVPMIDDLLSVHGLCADVALPNPRENNWPEACESGAADARHQQEQDRRTSQTKRTTLAGEQTMFHRLHS